MDESDNTDFALRLLLITFGFWIVMRTVNSDASKRTLVDHILGQKSGANQAPSTSSSGTTLGSTVGGAVNAAGGAIAGALGAAVNPFPGATGSRLDQGFDLTGNTFLSPFSGKVVFASQSDSGWRGGGYLAIQSATDPSKVIYMAEGLSPTVSVGQSVQAGQVVARPRSNPYNSIVGNIEAGYANPSNPGQPLAQVSSNKPSVALGFYNWLRSLGGPAATQTSNAGFP